MHRAAAVSAFALATSVAAAAGAEEDPSGRGVVGGALVGAELTVIGEALFGVEPSWAYFVGGALGASAGAYAGHVVEREAEHEVSLVLLAAGVGLVIPTLVWVGNARQPTPVPTETVRWLAPRARVSFDPERRVPSLSLDVVRARF
jgi:hypothetical protein